MKSGYDNYRRINDEPMEEETKKPSSQLLSSKSMPSLNIPRVMQQPLQKYEVVHVLNFLILYLHVLSDLY